MMNHKNWIMILIAVGLISMGDLAGARNVAISLTAARAQQSERVPAARVEFITAEELKSKIAKNEPLVVIDVRSSELFADSGNTIKGAIHFKIRRLRTRLEFAPLKNLPRDREVVTYCSCPNDESAIRAAQILIDGGFKHARVLKGGWSAWLKANGQVQPRLKS
ncbi:MAG TPA: rhodanese-like domain-containing protein [Blastocatellia bacterium]|nr:rhodanese-like domain-containing protein [Blastocatellia bacterium]